MGLSVHELTDDGDVRGSSFSVPTAFLAGFDVRDTVLMTVRTGHVRGNHYHRSRNELLIVLYADRWSLHWDTGEGTARQARHFAGAGGVLIAVPPFASHAIRNDGSEDLRVLAMADGAYDRRQPDIVRRVVVDS